MAGSWGHITDDDHSLLAPREFGNNVEPTDVYEVAEECFGMVWYLAYELTTYRNNGLPPTRDQVIRVIGEAEANSGDGVTLGGIA